MLDFDVMLMHCGEFGLYQKILFVFEAPFAVFVTFVLFGQLFMVLYPMNYWCEQHFACLDINSKISAAQRRNISFAWMDSGLFFQSDPCDMNFIDDTFLKDLAQTENDVCGRNRSAECTCFDNTTCSLGSSSQIAPTPSPRFRRHYGSFGRWQDPRPFGPPRRSKSKTTTTTTTEYSNEFGGPGWEDWSTTTDSQVSGTEENGRDWYDSDSNNNNDNPRPSSKIPGDERFPETTQKPLIASTKRPSAQSQTGTKKGGFGGKQRSSNSNQQRTPVNSFAGWARPECPKPRETFSLSLGMNTRILAHTMNRRLPNNTYLKIKNCHVRWNRSEVPYDTIATTEDWWCNGERYATISQAVFFLGAIAGGFLIGWIADTFGRVPALVIANILGALGGALSAVSNNIYAFSVFRFITGMAFDNCFTMMYILVFKITHLFQLGTVLEFCGPSYRTLVANLSIAVFYTLGTIALPLLAWLINDWRIFALVISLPMLLGLLALFFVPESARWLLSKGRAKEATQILRNFAKVNRKKVDEQVFLNFEQEATKLFSQMELEEAEPSLGAAFKTPRLRRTFILLIVFWSLIALVYDGHSRNIMNLANEDLNVFWLFGIASMTEFPADMLLIFTLDRFGRRWLAFGAMALSAAFSFIAAAVTPDMRIGFLLTAVISRFWVNVAFNIGLQYAAELLPTVIRAQGVNAIHIMGYVASIISPFVAAIGRSRPTLSLFILGICAIVAGIIALFLAETLGEELPNTLEEAEEFGRNQSFWNCPICSREREDEYPISPTVPATLETPTVMRNALRGSIRGETYRSSMISNAPSAGSRRSQLFGTGLGGRVANLPQPTEMTKLRRVTTH